MRQTFMKELSAYGVYDLRIDRDWTENGLPATKVEVFMESPKGLNTGKLHLRMTFAKNLGLDAPKMASLLRKRADRDIPKYIKDNGGYVK